MRLDIEAKWQMKLIHPSRPFWITSGTFGCDIYLVQKSDQRHIFFPILWKLLILKSTPVCDFPVRCSQRNLLCFFEKMTLINIKISLQFLQIRRKRNMYLLPWSLRFYIFHHFYCQLRCYINSNSFLCT